MEQSKQINPSHTNERASTEVIHRKVYLQAWASEGGERGLYPLDFGKKSFRRPCLEVKSSTVTHIEGQTTIL